MTNQSLDPIVQRILDRAEDCGLSLRALSLQSGLKPDYVRDLARGKSAKPKQENLEKIAETLGCSADYLRTGEDKPAAAGRPKRAAAAVPDDVQTVFAGMPLDLPIRGTVKGSASGAFAIMEGEAPVEFVPRPPILAGNRQAYGLIVQGSSMDPLFPEGDIALVHPGRAARPGDYVIIRARHRADRPAELFLKRLVGRTEATVTVEQLNPHRVIEFPAKYVEKIERVLTLRDILGR